MPIIEMYVPEGALDAQTKRTLHERVSRQVLEAEGASYDDSPLAKELTWMFIREQPSESWSVGGEFVSGDGEQPRFFTRISTPKGALDDERREAIATRVHEEITKAIGKEPSALESFVWIEESDTVSGGGTIVTFHQLMELLGLDPETRRPIEASASQGSGQLAGGVA